MVHEVVARKRKERSIRFFAGFRLTTLTAPLFPGNATAYAEFGVPLIPSGQKPVLFAANNFSFNRNRDLLVQWCKDTFKEFMLIQKTVQTTGEQVTVVPRVCPSLLSLGLGNTYPAYSAADLAILKPVLLL